MGFGFCFLAGFCVSFDDGFDAGFDDGFVGLVDADVVALVAPLPLFDELAGALEDNDVLGDEPFPVDGGSTFL